MSSIALFRSSRLHPVSAQSWCKSLLVGQLWCIHVWESIRECCLWVCFYFSSSAPHVVFVFLGCFLRWEVSGRTTAVLWATASRIYSKQHVAFLCNFNLAFSLCILLASRLSKHTVVLTQPQQGRNPILFF